ncbi:MAG: ABC transporter substrate-binding protein [Actinomycetota bacterium]
MTDTDIPARGRRRRVAALALGVVLLAGACGDGDDADAEVTEASTDATTSTSVGGGEAESSDTTVGGDVEPADLGDRVVATSFGEVEIPGGVETVLTLDAITALNMVSVGVEPSRYADPNGAVILQGLLAERGIELFEAGDGFSFNYESIAAEEPDLIVLTAGDGFDAIIDPLSDIAPTIVLPFGSSWRDAVLDTGAIFDRSEEAAQVVEALEGELALLAEEAATSPFSVSILIQTFGILGSLSDDVAASSLIAEAGIERPAAQSGAEAMPGAPGLMDFSAEVLGDHDADFVVVMGGVFYDSDALQELPTFQGLPAVQDGRWGVADGDLWFAGHPFAVHWILQDLRAIASGGGPDGLGVTGDADRRWAEFLELVG